MTARRTLRTLAWTSGGLFALAGLLYALRWPLLGPLVERRIKSLVEEKLKAEIEIEELEGSLLFGVTARGIRLRGTEASPLRRAAVRRIDVDYGFLGLGTPDVRVAGALILLAPSKRPSPPIHETVRDAVKGIRTLRIPARIRVSQVAILLPGGEEIAVQEIRIDPNAWSVRLRAPAFGSISASVEARNRGDLKIAASATEGPVRSVGVTLGEVRGGSQPLRIEALLGDRRLAWDGAIALGSKGAPDRLEGRLDSREGHAHISFDFLTGEAAIDADATITAPAPLSGTARIRARASGPVAGPAERWEVSEADLRSGDLRYRSVHFGRTEVRAGRGTPAHLPWRIDVRGARSRIAATGVFAWTSGPRLHGTIDAYLEDESLLRHIIPGAPPLHANRLRIAGNFAYDARGPSFSGSLRSGNGSAWGRTWSHLSASGGFGPSGIDVREALLFDSPLGPIAHLAGSLTKEGKIRAHVHGRKDALEVAGRWKDRSNFDLRILGIVRGVAIRAHAARNGAHGGGDFLLATAGGGWLASALTLIESEDGWMIAFPPGAIRLPNRRRLGYVGGAISLHDGTALLPDLPIWCEDPQASFRLRIGASWDKRRIQGRVELNDPRIEGHAVYPLVAAAIHDRAHGETEFDLRWGEKDRDHLYASGRMGKDNDVHASFRLRDLGHPLVRSLLPAVPLRGGIALDLSVRRSRAHGMLALRDVAYGGGSPLSLEIPILSDERSLLIPETTQTTPYGKLTIRGEAPLPWARGAGDLRLSARLETEDLHPLLREIAGDPAIKIREGKLAARAELRGTWKQIRPHAAVDLTAARVDPSGPTGTVTDLRLSARYREGTLLLSRLEGNLGKGPFRGEGRWDLAEPDRPFRFRLQGTDLLVLDRDLARVRISPDLTLAGSRNRGALLRGKVRVPLVLYYDELGTGGGSPSREIAVPGLTLRPAPGGGVYLPAGGLPGLDWVKLDLQVATEDECRVENSRLAALLWGETRIRGTLAAPSIAGRVRATSGEVKLAAGVFVRIQSAEVTVPATPGQEPRIRFDGTIGRGEGKIDVVVAGPLDHPTLSLRSDPPRSQRDLLAAIAFGQGPGRITTRGALGTAAVKVFEEIADEWPRAKPEDDLLSRFRFSLQDESRDGSLKPWELPPTGTLRGTVVRTEYTINDWLSVIGESDQKANVSGDLKLRLTFR